MEGLRKSDDGPPSASLDPELIPPDKLLEAMLAFLRRLKDDLETKVVPKLTTGINDLVKRLI